MRGKMAAGAFMRQTPSIGKRRLRGKGNQMYIVTQDHKNADQKPATANLVHESSNLVHDESSRLICPAYMQARFQPGRRLQ